MYHFDYDAGPPKTNGVVAFASPILPKSEPKLKETNGRSPAVNLVKRPAPPNYGRFGNAPDGARILRRPEDQVAALLGETKLNSDGNMIMHARIFAAAVKYQIPALKSLAASKFSLAVDSNWKHPTFAEAARIVYITTPDNIRELRDTVSDVITTRVELLESPEIKELLLGATGLAYELLRKSRNLPMNSPISEPGCSHCGQRVVISGCSCRRVCVSCAGKLCLYCGIKQ